MNKKFMVYAIAEYEENNISIECSDIQDMDNYAKACVEQGYKEVYTKAKPFYEEFSNAMDNSYYMPMCPRCHEPSYSLEKCPFCGQLIEWEEELAKGMVLNELAEIGVE